MISSHFMFVVLLAPGGKYCLVGCNTDHREHNAEYEQYLGFFNQIHICLLDELESEAVIFIIILRQT